MRERFEKRLLEAGKMVAAEQKPESAAIWDYVFADVNHVGENARLVPHDNRVFRAPPCSFPTHKTKN